MKQSIQELIMLADILDVGGFIKEAQDVDEIIRKVSITQPRLLSDFVEDLKTAFSSAAQSKTAFPNITEKSLPEILKVVDIILQHSQYAAPDISDRRLSEIYNPPTLLVDQVLALTDNISKVRREMEAEQNDAIMQKLVAEQHKFTTDLDNLYKKINKLRTSDKPEDLQKYEQFLKAYEERTGYSYEKK